VVVEDLVEVVLVVLVVVVVVVLAEVVHLEDGRFKFYV
jgi:hypothetical protein